MSLTATVSVTGDCLNNGSGAFLIKMSGGVGNVRYIRKLLPPPAWTQAQALPINQTTYFLSNLTGGTYSYEVYDQINPISFSIIANAYISSGNCADLSAHTNTYCGVDNGSITAITTNYYRPNNFYLYENNSGFIDYVNTQYNYGVFNNLSAGTYYVLVDDGGGCTGVSESCIVKPSEELDYEFFTVNDSGCSLIGDGKIYIINLNGFPPYTYLWSNGQTTSSISGLTEGTYTVTVTDSRGCVKSNESIVITVPKVDIVQVTKTTPDCNQYNGIITVEVTGGTPPYSFAASNGQVSNATFQNTFSVTGIPAGVYTITVFDSGLCSDSIQETLTTPNSFTTPTATISPAYCGNAQGSITLNFTSGVILNYTILNPNGSSNTGTMTQPSKTFSNLQPGNYVITMSSPTGCEYTQTYTVPNSQKFIINTSITGTTCSQNNGILNVSLSPGTTDLFPPFTYNLSNNPVSTNQPSNKTYTGLSSGNYILTITDSQGCQQTKTINIDSSNNLVISLSGTNANNSNDGTIELYITQGEPTFTIDWSQNVNGQTGLHLNNLTAGTYSVVVTDSNGCTATDTIDIDGYNLLTNYGSYTYCESIFLPTGEYVEKKPQQMLLEGFYDLTTGDEGCVLNGAQFYAQVNLNGTTGETLFYTSTGLNDYPTDSQWYSAMVSLLTSFPEIGNVDLDFVNNIITIQTGCDNQTLSFSNLSVIVGMRIAYDISCVSCSP